MYLLLLNLLINVEHTWIQNAVACSVGSIFWPSKSYMLYFLINVRKAVTEEQN